MMVDGVGLLGQALLDQYQSKLPRGQWLRLKELGAI